MPKLEVEILHGVKYDRGGRRYILLEGPSLMDLENIGGACGGPVLEFGNIGGAPIILYL